MQNEHIRQRDWVFSASLMLEVLWQIDVPLIQKAFQRR
jgi:hypothetical protein